MSELKPVPLQLQLQRASLEFEREGRIFHLPKEKFFTGSPGLDLSVMSNGHRASTPIGPAAGPHTQMLQNIVLCWLAGSRLIELKTIQHLDELQIPRPCIDSANVTYNVEWSQELKLETSLREYVGASMFLQILKASELLGELYPAGADETIFDMSVGYNLEGIRSPRVRAWMESMKDASSIIDGLRAKLSGRFRPYRDLPFKSQISDTITLSTFHGCPPEEIEAIVTFLLRDVGLHVCVKMNPTLLGKEELAHFLYDVLGYRDVVLSDEAFANDMKFADAENLVSRLDDVARSCGRQFSVKFSNTLVVRNHRNVFKDELMYMSGPALHVITLNLVKKWRDSMGVQPPTSFSAGVTAQNVADMVAMNFVPVTTCTDLLKTGGYSRLSRYMENLASAMRECGATTLNDFVVRHAGNGRTAVERAAQQLRGRISDQWTTDTFVPEMDAWLDRPKMPLREQCRALTSDAIGPSPVELEQMLINCTALLNTDTLVAKATDDRRYRFEQNRTSPRKTGANLDLFDCIACDKCVGVCPNAANFSYEVPMTEIAYRNFEVDATGGFRAVEVGHFAVQHSRQFANYAEFCNACGNCDTACPENGGPNVSKPRLFGTREHFEHGGDNAFFIAEQNGSRSIRGTISGKQYSLVLDGSGIAHFTDPDGQYTIRMEANELVRAHVEVPHRLDLLRYLQLKMLLEGISDIQHVNYINVMDGVSD